MNRKDEHINLALSQEVIANDFDRIRFVHNGLSDVDFTKISLQTDFLGHVIELPFYINAMTGGTQKAFEINSKLSKIASYYNIPIATGSLSPILKDKNALNSFKIIRDNNPNGLVIANIGADKTVEDVKKVLGMFKADALQIHINQVQEIVMPEGERDFSLWQNNIKEITNSIDIPVIVKEVGFGMSHKTLETLKSLNIKNVDISGRGGTNFALIENSRRNNKFYSFNTWGLSTVESLLESSKVNEINILASGGIRCALDIVKSLSLGANAVGLSSYFLKLVNEYDIEEIIFEIDNLILEIKSIMAILCAKEIKDLRKCELIVDSELMNFITQRNINKNILISR